ncbi:hypothetical protein [Cellvibrio sp. QJXJ]|uniref:hypothetical protein n=1 Tax=Cellvibrio sp. QJXJ TaxID=2964606 RepID=UPI0021C27B7E|nr:hypothetical protein [Cellvibrio sp. QJXJ]UUA75115.1 hypothetical protein NNX04_21915 [Cellvibrio sp. QJXJ]
MKTPKHEKDAKFNPPKLIIKVSADTDEIELSKLRQLLQPSRIAALRLIHSRQSISMPDLMTELNLKNHAVHAIFNVLVDLDLISVQLESNPGHGLVRVAKSLLGEKPCIIGLEILLPEVQPNNELTEITLTE